METVKEVINSCLYDFVESGGIIAAQNILAVGRIGGTIPETPNNIGILELPTSDLSNGGVVTGLAIGGKKVCYTIRYQGFGWYNLVHILNYACKAKEIWDMECPIMIRAIAMEGSIGPVAGSSHHSLCYRMPGIKIVSPMTPSEYRKVYADFMKSGEPTYISEHRGSYSQTEDLNDIHFDDPDFVLFPISITRFAAMEASRTMLEAGCKVAVYHQVNLKPYVIKDRWIEALAGISGLVLDDDYGDGIASTIAHKLSEVSGSTVYSMGLEDKTAGFSNRTDNLPPNAEKICSLIRTYHD
jgi:transketolase C-terminal domain/subunit